MRVRVLTDTVPQWLVDAAKAAGAELISGRQARQECADALTPTIADIPPSRSGIKNGASKHHGTNARYHKGCRCDQCTEAHRVAGARNPRGRRLR